MSQITSTRLNWRAVSEVTATPSEASVGQGKEQLPGHNVSVARPVAKELDARGYVGDEAPLGRLMKQPTTADQILATQTPLEHLAEELTAVERFSGRCDDITYGKNDLKP